MEKLEKHKLITSEKADALTDNFINALKIEVEKNETWAWFDIDELNLYLQTAMSMTGPGKSLSGIRIFIGKYPQNENDAYFTVYISPTEHNTNAEKTPNDAKIEIDALNLGGTGTLK
jgi:hypothetical protein